MLGSSGHNSNIIEAMTEIPSAFVVSQNYTYICGRKRQRTAALQDANAPTYAPENAKRLGVRLSSAAFESTRKVTLIVRHPTSNVPVSLLTIDTRGAG
jgi:hypothetical protein